MVDDVRSTLSAFFKILSRKILRIVEADTNDPVPYQIPTSLLNTLRYIFTFFMVVLKQKDVEHRNVDRIEKASDLNFKSLRQARQPLFCAHNKKANL